MEKREKQKENGRKGWKQKNNRPASLSFITSLSLWYFKVGEALFLFLFFSVCHIFVDFYVDFMRISFTCLLSFFC